jgi:predicted hydrocarbon binding protein
MKLEQLRQRLDIPVGKLDEELFAAMNERVRSLAGGNFLLGMGEVLYKYEHDQPIRPHYPNKMQFIYMRDRQTFTFALFPELLPLAYQAGRAIGAAFDAPRRTGITLAEAMASAIDVASQFDYGRQEIVRVEDAFAVYRTYECADCYGLPNLGLCLCAYEAGIAAGALEMTLGCPVQVTEVRCCANGDPYDEFEVRVEN